MTGQDVDGRTVAEVAVLLSRREDITLGNPFGGFGRGIEAVYEQLERAASHYRDGETIAFETVTRFVGADVAYTVTRDGENGQALLVFNPADGRTINTYALPEATGFPVGVSVGHDRRVVTATSDGQVYGFAP